MPCYLIRVRKTNDQGRPPYSEKGADDDFAMVDIGRKKPATLVKLYAEAGVHIIHMTRIPDWEGPTT